jgi:Protein of unknown function (DUF3305)
MAQDHFMIGAVVAKRRLRGPWASYAWLPVAALPDAPAIAPWTRLGTDGDDETFYAGAVEVALHSKATGHYRDNLTAAQPSLWIVLRPVGDEVELASATADPYEGEALADSVGDIVEAVPMPAGVRARIQEFFDAFHVEQSFFKRKRDRADPEAMARRERPDRKPERDE